MSGSINNLVKSILSGGLNSSTSNTGGIVNINSNTATSGITSASQSLLGSLVGSTSVSSKDMRLVIAPAGVSAASSAATPANSGIFSTSQLAQHQGGTSTAATTAAAAQTTNFYSGIMQPLMVTNGVMFPYAPTVNFSQDVDYSSVGNGMVHTNQDYMAYQRTPSVKLTIAGKFTIQNQYEGLYMLAVIQFFRAVSKMFFGVNAGNNAGLPPPILIVNGFGTYMFNNLPCILLSHSWDMDDTVDTIDVADPSGGLTKLPSLLTLSLTLQVQQTPYNMSTSFDLNAFRSGALIKSGGGWI